MERIIQALDHEVWLDKIEKPYQFVSPFDGDGYALLLVINATNVTDEEQIRLSDSIVATGCRYAVCTGHECSTWDDSIDYSPILSDPSYDPPDDKFVMTTWHEDESIEDVVEYFRSNTVFDDFVPTKFLVLFVGDSLVLYEQTRRILLQVFAGDIAESPKATDIKAQG